jgi:hypothetical protein
VDVRNIWFHRSCTGLFKAQLIKGLSGYFFVFCFEMKKRRFFSGFRTYFLLSLADIALAADRFVAGISNKSFPVMNVAVLKDIEILLEVLLDDCFSKDLFMEL